MFQKNGCHLTGFEVQVGELCALKQFLPNPRAQHNGLVKGDFCSLPMSTVCLLAPNQSDSDMGVLGGTMKPVTAAESSLPVLQDISIES